MAKNWVKIKFGTWELDIGISTTPQWRDEGEAYIDPEAVSSIATDHRLPESCVIYLGYSGKSYTVKESVEHIMALIQSALP